MSLIAENMLTRVDEEGFSTTMMKGIIDYRKDNDVAIPKDKKYVTIPSGQKRLRTTTAGWKLLAEWADGTESWIALKDLKESHPVDLAEFSKARSISDEASVVKPCLPSGCHTP